MIQNLQLSKDIIVHKRRSFLFNKLLDYKILYLFLLPGLILTFIFGYLPMFINIIAFMKYDILNPGWLGLKSPFCGLDNFKFVFDAWFWKLAWRTLYFSFFTLLFSFPASIVLALMFNELKSLLFKRIAQTVSYIPHFVSWVTVAGLFYLFLSVDQSGLINNIKQAIFGGERISYMQNPSNFLPVIIISQIWKEVGWGSILYIAAISTIDIQLYEAARVDGAGRWRQMIHITLPGLLPTTAILLIFSLGGIFNINFDQFFNFTNPVIRPNVETINVYTYYKGIEQQQYSLAAAVGLFQGVITFLLTAITNKTSKKLSDTGII